MTVIAWDGKTLAADKRMTDGDAIGKVTKIKRIVHLNGMVFLVGMAGSISGGAQMMRWFAAGGIVENFPKLDDNHWAVLLVIGNFQTVGYYGEPHPVVIENSQFAIGSGELPARAAMLCGASAEEAVAIASQLVHGCGDGVDVLTFGD